MERGSVFVIDGARTLRAETEQVFGARVEAQRCQLHKRRNVEEYLPKNGQGNYGRRIRDLYAMTGYAIAKAELERVNQSTARSLEEGLEKTLRCMGWG